MAHYFIAHLEALVFQAEPFTAFGAMHGFSPVKKRGQDDDEEEYRANGGEDFQIMYGDKEFGDGNGGLLMSVFMQNIFITIAFKQMVKSFHCFYIILVLRS
jgi:hypothetical protein